DAVISFIFNCSNNRSNLTTIICKMVGGESGFPALDFLLNEVAEHKPLVWTTVFFNTRDTTRCAGQYLREKFPPDSPYCHQIFSMWATKSPRAKHVIIRQFCKGKINVLLATEVAGLGIDFGNVRRSVQYLAPQKLSELTQHVGRAGRNGKPALAILLVE
ncbi:P-loop containing nucleoside triphosphate hydrolase protein, partial [Cytidiella melzeri]